METAAKNKTAPPQPGDGHKEALLAIDAALDKKALEPVLLDVRGICSYANYVLVLSGRSDRQVEAVAEGVSIALKASGAEQLGSEGMKSGQWALLDFGDLIVHVFHHPVREHYNLESMWVEAHRVPIDVPDEARIPEDQAY